MSVVECIVATVVGQLKKSKRVVVAVSGPQGSGKTTVSREAAALLSAAHHIPTIAISLDDFYKPYNELQEIAKRGNPLLKHRGLPGTHDTAMLVEFLLGFKAGKADLSVPSYDKSLHNGAGDRSGFIPVATDTSVVLLEGWMVGFRPIGKGPVEEKAQEISREPWSIKPSCANLLEIEDNLHAYVSVWDQLDGFVRLVPRELKFVYEWRLQQEHELRESRGTGMTDSEVKQFVDQYMPCYLLYNDTLPGPETASVFSLDIEHEAKRIESRKTREI